MKRWNEEFFQYSTETIEAGVFTLGTAGICDLIKNEVQRSITAKNQVIRCGAGRHAVEPAGREFSVAIHFEKEER